MYSGLYVFEQHLASLFEGGGSPQGESEGVSLVCCNTLRTLPQSKIKDFCQPPQRGGQGRTLNTYRIASFMTLDWVISSPFSSPWILPLDRTRTRSDTLTSSGISEEAMMMEMPCLVSSRIML